MQIRKWCWQVPRAAKFSGWPLMNSYEMKWCLNSCLKHTYYFDSIILFPRSACRDHALQPGPSAGLPLLPVPAPLSPGAGWSRLALLTGTRRGESLLTRARGIPKSVIWEESTSLKVNLLIRNTVYVIISDCAEIGYKEISPVFYQLNMCQ